MTRATCLVQDCRRTTARAKARGWICGPHLALADDKLVRELAVHDRGTRKGRRDATDRLASDNAWAAIQRQINERLQRGEQ